MKTAIGHGFLQGSAIRPARSDGVVKYGGQARDVGGFGSLVNDAGKPQARPAENRSVETVSSLRHDEPSVRDARPTNPDQVERSNTEGDAERADRHARRAAHHLPEPEKEKTSTTVTGAEAGGSQPVHDGMPLLAALQQFARRQAEEKSTAVDARNQPATLGSPSKGGMESASTTAGNGTARGPAVRSELKDKGAGNTASARPAVAAVAENPRAARKPALQSTATDTPQGTAADQRPVAPRTEAGPASGVNPSTAARASAPQQTAPTQSAVAATAALRTIRQARDGNRLDVAAATPTPHATPAGQAAAIAAAWGVQAASVSQDTAQSLGKTTEKAEKSTPLRSSRNGHDSQPAAIAAGGKAHSQQDGAAVDLRTVRVTQHESRPEPAAVPSVAAAISSQVAAEHAVTPQEKSEAPQLGQPPKSKASETGDRPVASARNEAVSPALPQGETVPMATHRDDGKEGGDAGAGKALRSRDPDDRAIDASPSAPPDRESPKAVGAPDRAPPSPAVAPVTTTVRLVDALAEAGQAALARPVPQHPQAGTVAHPAHTLRIELHPAELGMVVASLRMAGEQLSVELRPGTAEAYRHLASDSETIAKSLKNLGLDVDSVTILQPSLAAQPATRTDAGNSSTAMQGRDTPQFQSGTSGGSGDNSGGQHSGRNRSHDGQSLDGPSPARRGRPGGSLFI